MMTFKQFLASQDDGIGDEEAVKKYNDYKLDFRRQQLNEFFLAHKEEEWFKSKYQPDECNKRRQEQLASLAKRKDVFLDLMEKNWLENISLDCDKSDELVRLLDATTQTPTEEKSRDESESEVVAKLSSVIIELRSELKSLREEVDQLKNREDGAITALKARVDAETALVDGVRTRQATRSEELAHHRQDVASHARRIRLLDRKIDDLDRYSRVNNLELHGLPHKSRENVIKLLAAVARLLGIGFDAGDVVAANRIFHGRRPQHIVFELRTRFVRDEWIQASKRCDYLDSREVVESFDSQQVYVTRNETPLTYRILSGAEKYAQEHGGDAWCDNGKVYLQKSVDSRPIQIKDLEDLDDLSLSDKKGR